ncbi:hypothetical protein [Mucilaginibacter sp. UR6-11]|uniref:hypothetical protein n=1 Tax=Mucilaginibacter sp. UR6-11 TaxID=1435644 RepID=UPI001E645A5F|nr:hypothetical protein [Mucilaginibacter sp. UR6-11]MCC8426856.1 hypothetical protein [Mucilaginibacter sp. UR6-11]
MKTNLLSLSSILVIVMMLASCKREQVPAIPYVRTIKFILHTEKDFSNVNDNITFSLYIRNSSKVLLDSAIAPMKIKDIPNATKQLVFEKKVYNDNSKLAAGFRYTIENVGSSWHIDTLMAGEQFKTIDYSFQ